MDITMTPTSYIPIHGTWDLGKDAWWRHGSKFCHLAAENQLICEEQFETYYWSGLVDGVNWKSVLTFGKVNDNHETWDSAGLALRYRLKYTEPHKRNLIVHSHGLQVLAYSGIEVRNVISVGSPIRKDMYPLYAKLQKNSQSWLHISDNSWDKMGLMGQLYDGQWFGKRTCPFSLNHTLGEVGHSRILRDDKYMKYWVSQGWFDFLRKERN